MGKLFNKAVLIYPKFPYQSFWGFELTLKKHVLKNKHKVAKRPLPPLGLMGLYRHLNENYYDEVVLIDRNVDPRPLENIVKDADHVYLGGMITQEETMIQDVKLLKSLGKTVIVGGTVVDNNSPLMKLADHLVENEAEMVIDDLVKGLKNGTAKKIYKGIHTPPEKFFKPDYSSIDMNSYINMAIQISRGCPENCEFCDITSRFGKNPRYTPWEHIEDSFRQLDKLGSDLPLFVVDDNFIGNPKKTIEVLENIYNLERELGHKFSKYTELTMRLADNTKDMKKLRRLLKKTNFNMFFVGVETPNIESLLETGKVQNLQGSKSIIDKIEYIAKETGATITAGMIHGFDNDTRANVDEITNFINSMPSAVVMFGLLNALVNTRLYDRLLRQGRIKTRPSGNNSDGTINFIPQHFSVKQAEEDYVKILKNIYPKDGNAYFKRVIAELDLFNPNYFENKTDLKDSLYSAAKILFTDGNVFKLLKNLPKVHRIAKKKVEQSGDGDISWFKSAKYRYIIGSYFSLVAKYRHFYGQTKLLEKGLKKRKYEPWELYSFNEIQASNISSVELLEKPSEKHSSIYDNVKLTLENGYEFVGTKLEALRHFASPYIKEKMEKIKNIHVPNLKNIDILNLEVDILSKVHINKPKILGDIDSAKVKEQIREALSNKKENLAELCKYYSNTLRQLKVRNKYTI
jgi:radical SAM superfamily enzyme YgiQ (UPF0313 family)